MALMNLTIRHNGTVKTLFNVESAEQTEEGLRVWYHPDAADKPDNELYEGAEFESVDTGDPSL
jgi:hypothetical protein